VTEVFVHQGQQINVGTPMFQMDTDAEDMALKRVQTSESVRAIRSAQYAGPQLEVVRDLAKLAVEKATANLVPAKFASGHAQAEIIGGVAQQPQTAIEAVKNQLAQIELDQAKDQQKQLEFAIERHNKIDDLAKQLSQEQEAFLNRKRERLTVRAPHQGRVKSLLVGKGSFAELGSILGQIE
jgi:multidrug resistance efflux pump